MPRSKIIDVDEILLKFENAIQETGKELADEISMIYVKAIRSFYRSYSPRSYSRTYSSYLATSNVAGIPSYKRINKYSCDAGITVDSKYMGEPYQKKHGWNPSAEFIFDRTWNKGIHGFTNKEVAAKKKYNRFMTSFTDMIWNPMESYTSLMKSHNFLNGYHAVDTIGYQKIGLAPSKSRPPRTYMNLMFKEIKNSVDSRFSSKFSL